MSGQNLLVTGTFPIQSLELPDSIIDGQKATSNVSLSDSADRPSLWPHYYKYERCVDDVDTYNIYMWMDKVDPHTIAIE